MNDNELEQLCKELDIACERQNIILSVDQKEWLVGQLVTIKESILNGIEQRDASNVHECYERCIDKLLDSGVYTKEDIQSVVYHMFNYLEIIY